MQSCLRRQFSKTFLGNEIPVSQSLLDWVLAPWTFLWLNSALSPGQGQEGPLGLHSDHAQAPNSAVGHENTILHTVFNTFPRPSSPQLCSYFPGGVLKVFLFSGRLHFPSRWTTQVLLFENIRNLICRRIPTISPLGWLISVAERLLACLSFPYSPALQNRLALGGNHFFVHKRSTWGWLTALCCYPWVRVNSRWCRETSNRQSLQTET